MDFSQFNGPEQAHMTKVIEKKQVSEKLSWWARVDFVGSVIVDLVGSVIVAATATATASGGDGHGHDHG
jgi:hypothetical protein